MSGGIIVLNSGKGDAPSDDGSECVYGQLTLGILSRFFSSSQRISFWE